MNTIYEISLTNCLHPPNSRSRSGCLLIRSRNALARPDSFDSQLVRVELFIANNFNLFSSCIASNKLEHKIGFKYARDLGTK